MLKVWKFLLFRRLPSCCSRRSTSGTSTWPSRTSTSPQSAPRSCGRDHLRWVASCQLESRRCDHFTSSTDCAACRPWRSQFLCRHETSSTESGEAKSSGEIFALHDPGVKTLPRSTRSTPHQRAATTGAAHSPPPWLANSSCTRESSPSTGPQPPPPPTPPPLTFLLNLLDSNPVGRDGQALELPCPSLPVFVKDMQLMCQMIGQ